MKCFVSLALLLSVSASYAADQYGRPVGIDLVNRDSSHIHHEPRAEEKDILKLGTLLESGNKERLNDLFEYFSDLDKEYHDPIKEKWYGTRSFDGNTRRYVYHVHNKVAKRNNSEELALMKPFSELFGYIPGKNYNKQ